MFSLLAQVTETTTTTLVQPVYHFDGGAWIPSGEQLVRGAIVMCGILIAALVVLALARRSISRFRLTAAFVVATVAMTVYFGIGAIKPDRFRDPLDSASFWIHRIFYAALLFVAVRLFDRIVVVPLMTRGGKVPLQRFVHQIIIIVLGIFVVLGYGSRAFGWDIDKFLAGSAVVSIVLGLALQETLGNFFSGMVMQASSPFAIGNWIIVGGIEGRVVDMNWRAVTIHTREDNFVVIPNSTIAKENITNFHAPTVSTARNVKIALESEMIPGDVIDILLAAARSAPGVLASPAPEVYLSDFDGSTIVYIIRFWMDHPAQHEEVEHAVRLAAWYQMRRHGFTVPYTNSTVELNTVARKERLAGEAASTQRRAAIESVPLLAPLSDAQKGSLAGQAGDVVLAPGQTLFRQGDSGDSFYVIDRGSVEVLIGDTPETQKSIATLGPGDFFGEMSALTGQPRTATIRAKETLTAVEIEKRDLDAIFAADPKIMEQISQVVARRNIEREALLKGLSQPTPQEAVAQQKSLLARMLRFFGREPKA